MKRLLTTISLVLLLSTSCVRQKLEEVLYTKALLPVLIDWESKALMYVDNDPKNDLYSASVWLFPTADSEYQGSAMEYKLSDPQGGYIEVPIGTYDVLVFNKTVGDYTNAVGFRGTDSFDTFEYYTNINSQSSLFSSVVDDDFAAEPDMLAAWTFEGDQKLVVTFDEILYYQTVSDVRSRVASESASSKATVDNFDDLPDELKQLLYIVPERIVHNVTVEERLDNLHSVSYAQANLRGMSHSVLLASREYSTTTSPYLLTFTSKYIDYYYDGCDMMTSSTNVIGLPSQNSDYSVETIFKLIDTYDDTTIWPIEPTTGYYYDVSDQVNSAEIGLDKCLGVTLYYCGGDPILPDLDPSNSGAFDVGVNEWSGPVMVPL